MALTSFFSGLRSELSHIVWPDGQTALWSAIAVIVIAFLIGYYLGLWDALFALILKVLIS